METKFTQSETVYIAGSNQDQRNWRIDIYENDIIFCTVFGKTRDEVEANAKLMAAARETLEACYWALSFGKNGESHDKIIIEKLKKATE